MGGRGGGLRGRGIGCFVRGLWVSFDGSGIGRAGGDCIRGRVFLRVLGILSLFLSLEGRKRV